MIDYTKDKDYFIINGVNCRTLGLWCDTQPVPNMAKARVTVFQTSADEDRTTPDDSFEDIKYKLTFFTFDNANYDNTAIYQYITGARTLQISRLVGYYFKVRKVELSSDQSFHGEKIKYTATFTLAPFKYGVINDEITLQPGDYIENTGTRYSRPTIEVAGSSTINFTCNGELFKLVLPDSGQVVVIDSERLVTYDAQTGVVLQGATDGWYPMLAVGQNQINWTCEGGATVYVKVKKNERWY